MKQIEEFSTSVL